MILSGPAGKKKNDKSFVLTEKNNLFQVNVTVDFFNRRLWVNEYDFEEPGNFVNYLWNIAAEYNLEKIILPARGGDREILEQKGFNTEGRVEGFFRGEAACFLTAYLQKARRLSRHLPAQMAALKEITARPRVEPAPLPPGVELRSPGKNDIQPLSRLFSKVFSTYPTPLDNPEYLAASMEKNIFKILAQGGQIISAAAAEINPIYNNAELTNCATLPGYRGRGLMANLIASLEQDCAKQGIGCLYSLARASSYGMNLIFHRLGYQYRGTLINNCHICGSYENMNIWVKA